MKNELRRINELFERIDDNGERLSGEEEYDLLCESISILADIKVKLEKGE